MTAVAIVGVDGAGKTTLARDLAEGGLFPARYLYMGSNIESANVSLPTSKLILALKLRSFRKKAAALGITDPDYVSTHHQAHRSVRYGKLGATARMLNRLAEVAYRLLVSWAWQLRGWIVVYDRDPVFEAALIRSGSGRLTDRIYYRIIARISPEPDLVLFLEAPPAVLHSRKSEVKLESLEKRQVSYLAHGRKTSNFVTLDASLPPDLVLREAANHVARLR